MFHFHFIIFQQLLLPFVAAINDGETNSLFRLKKAEVIEKLTPLASILPVFISTLERKGVRNSHTSKQIVSDIIDNDLVEGQNIVVLSSNNNTDTEIDSVSSESESTDSSSDTNVLTANDWAAEDIYISSKPYNDNFE